MHEVWSNMNSEINRLSFMKNGIIAAGVGVLANSLICFRGKGARRT